LESERKEKPETAGKLTLESAASQLVHDMSFKEKIKVEIP
jgi:hypothetical protein